MLRGKQHNSNLVNIVNIRVKIQNKLKHVNSILIC